MVHKNSVLMVAYHFPPFRGSSGPQRTVSFCRYLPAFGWSPIVLTVRPSAYPDVCADGGLDKDLGVLVKRVFAFDAARHLSIRGRYPDWLALPDRWISWVVSAIPAGLNLMRYYKPRILWSTYPIATAHLLAFFLHKLTGIPWVADFRDPMTEINPLTKQRAPSNPRLWRARSWIERLTMSHSCRSVFATEQARRIYADRCPNKPRSHLRVIANGYDESSFASAEKMVCNSKAQDKPLLLLHSGVLYPSPDRDPSAFFSALARLKRGNLISSATIRVVLRATGHDEVHRKLISANEVQDLVFLEPPLPYHEALSEMLTASGLLIFQGYTSNPAIPAKLYEYFRARRPIFAMVAPEGETAKTLGEARMGKIVPLTSVEEITRGLMEFLEDIRNGSSTVMNQHEVSKYSREHRTQELARLFDETVL